jgi:hypothetical protein
MPGDHEFPRDHFGFNQPGLRKLDLVESVLGRLFPSAFDNGVNPINDRRNPVEKGVSPLIFVQDGF